MRKLSMHIVVILSFGFLFSVITLHLPCEKRRSNCCVGYILETNKSMCVECEVGYIGPRCKTPCPAPTYGPTCRLLCNCNGSECDNIKGCATEDQQVYQTNISYSGSKLPITVSHGRLNEVDYSEVSAECASVTQTQQLAIKNESKFYDWTSSIRLSIILLGGFCIVMILLHVSLSVITWNDIKIELVSIHIEERNYDYS
nr:cell death abnormality protein 1-like [Crassostrea gigas]